MTSWAEGRRHSALELDSIRLEAETVACPECGAPVGERCRNVNDGRPLNKLPHHKRSVAVSVGDDEARKPTT